MSDDQFPLRAQQWLNSFDTGRSSKAIFHYMTLGIKGRGTPSDPSDLARCLRLLDRFPERKPRLHEMATVSDDWALLMEHWGAVVDLFNEEVGPEGYGYNHDWDAPKTYDLMHSVFYDKIDGMWVRKRPTPSTDRLNGGAE